jgi:hypothetical protein
MHQIFSKWYLIRNLLNMDFLNVHWTKYILSDGFDLTDKQWNKFIRRNKMSDQEYPSPGGAVYDPNMLAKSTQEV